MLPLHIENLFQLLPHICDGNNLDWPHKISYLKHCSTLLCSYLQSQHSSSITPSPWANGASENASLISFPLLSILEQIPISYASRWLYFPPLTTVLTHNHLMASTYTIYCLRPFLHSAGVWIRRAVREMLGPWLSATSSSRFCCCLGDFILFVCGGTGTRTRVLYHQPFSIFNLVLWGSI